MQAVLERLEAHSDATLEALIDLARIPSVSADISTRQPCAAPPSA